MVDININVPAVEKLIELCASGIGVVAGPMLEKRKAQSEADALRIKAQGVADNIQLIADAQNEARQIFSGSSSYIQGEFEVGEQIKMRIAFQEGKRQRNIQSVVSMAAEEIKDKEVQDHEIDHDWTARFFSDVQDVSSEQMQQTWAKILAGEVETPGRTSLRTLAILKNMTQKDAELFSNVAQFVIGEFIFDERIVGKVDGFPDATTLLQLEDYGLIHAGAQFSKPITSEYVFEDKFHIYCISKDNLVAGDNRKIEVRCHPLTLVGKELYKFIEVQLNMDYLSVLANFLKGKNAKLKYARYGDEPGIPTPWIQVEPRPTPKPVSDLAS